MTDVLTPAQRQLNMSRIRGKDTKPEMLLRRSLHAAGYRYRLHVSDLPGKPDLVFPKYQAVIQVHGCFWHGHDCPLFKWPTTRQVFWQAKIAGTKDRDQRTSDALTQTGWRQLIVWECALKGPARHKGANIIEKCTLFLKGNKLCCEMSGRWLPR